MRNKILHDILGKPPLQNWSPYKKSESWGEKIKSTKFVRNKDRICDDQFFQSEIEINQPLKRRRIGDSLSIPISYELLLRKINYDPYELFKPSSVLVGLVNNHVERPNETELREYKKNLNFYEKPVTNRFEIRGLEEIISREVEDFLTYWANRIELANEAKNISEKGQFTPDVSRSLIDRLQLDPRDPYPVLDQLFVELFELVCRLNLERSWGKIVEEKGDLYLDVDEGAFSIPEFELLGDNRWIEI